MDEKTEKWLLGLSDAELVEALFNAGRIPWREKEYWLALMPKLRYSEARVIKSTDCHCPSCGHNRCNSAVSSVDNEDGTFYCQQCSAEWREIP